MIFYLFTSSNSTTARIGRYKKTFKGILSCYMFYFLNNAFSITIFRFGIMYKMDKNKNKVDKENQFGQIWTICKNYICKTLKIGHLDKNQQN